MNYVKCEVDSRGVATVVLSRAEKHNALSAQMISELTDIAVNLTNTPNVRVVVLSALGKSFCAGADLEWMRNQIAASRQERMSEARKLANMLQLWNALPLPVIANVEGNAFGGGIGLISIADIVICSKSVKFGLTETRLGLIPATISPYVAAKIGQNAMRFIGLSAKIFTASEALKIGLVSIVESETNIAVTNEIENILHTSPQAVAASKALFCSLGTRIDEGVIDTTIGKLADTWESADAIEGISAFFEKRPARWVNA